MPRPNFTTTLREHDSQREPVWNSNESKSKYVAEKYNSTIIKVEGQQGNNCNYRFVGTVPSSYYAVRENGYSRQTNAQK